MLNEMTAFDEETIRRNNGQDDDRLKLSNLYA